MTKAEKKIKINSILESMYNSTTINELEMYTSNLISELYSSGFKLSQLPTVSSAIDLIDLFVSDIVKDLAQTVGKEKDKETKEKLFLSSSGIITLIDLSLLSE